MTNGFIIALIVIYAISAVSAVMMLLHNTDALYSIVLFSITIMIIFLLLVADYNVLKEKMPAPKLFSMGWVIIPPVYLFVRARYLQQKQYYLIIYIAIFVIEYAVITYLEKNMIFY